MNRQSIVATLRAHETELRGLGVASLSLFGSAARDDLNQASDIDLAVRLDGNFSRGGFDYFGRLEELRSRLAKLMGRAVDVVEEPVERAPFQREIDRDRVLAV